MTNNYIDGFVFPISKIHLEKYKGISEQIAEIWKEYGALAYFEYVGDEMRLEGVKSFIPTLDAKEDEVIVFGWMVFPSKEVRDKANKLVPQDSRIPSLISKLTHSERIIFDSERMLYGGFKPLVQST
jgi:uncharacterized protein YbaA (DUF1428 family)